MTAAVPAGRAADIRAQATVRCDCGTAHHLTVTLDPEQIDAAVRRVMTGGAREAAHRGSGGGR